MSVAGASAYPVVPVFHPRREARRAVKRGYPRGAGSVRLCRTIQAVERLLEQRLVDAVVLDARHCDGVALDAARPVSSHSDVRALGGAAR